MKRTVRTFDVELTITFRGTYTGYKLLPGATNFKRSVRRRLRKAGIKDNGVAFINVAERSTK